MERSGRRIGGDAGNGALVMEPLSFRAPLFVPGNRPERFAKAALSGADAVILDLEDAVPAAAKDVARAGLTTTFTELPVVVRVNASGTPWHDADVAVAASLNVAAIMLPKSERIEDLARIAAQRPVIALVETVAGVAGARALAASGHVTRLAFGSVDYAADLGCDHVSEALAAARAEIVFASRLARLLPPLDGVTTELKDYAATEDDARRAAMLGFGGKLAIHPRQVEGICAAFRPDPEQVEWAQRVLAGGEGAVSVDGAMVDEPVRNRARNILARVSAIGDRNIKSPNSPLTDSRDLS